MKLDKIPDCWLAQYLKNDKCVLETSGIERECHKVNMACARMLIGHNHQTIVAEALKRVGFQMGNLHVHDQSLQNSGETT
jgi:hypothetical protein